MGHSATMNGAAGPWAEGAAVGPSAAETCVGDGRGQAREDSPPDGYQSRVERPGRTAATAGHAGRPAVALPLPARGRP